MLNIQFLIKLGVIYASNHPHSSIHPTISPSSRKTVYCYAQQVLENIKNAISHSLTNNSNAFTRGQTQFYCCACHWSKQFWITSVHCYYSEQVMLILVIFSQFSHHYVPSILVKTKSCKVVVGQISWKKIADFPILAQVSISCSYLENVIMQSSRSEWCKS